MVAKFLQIWSHWYLRGKLAAVDVFFVVLDDDGDVVAFSETKL